MGEKCPEELCRFCGETDNIRSDDGRTTCGSCAASAPDEVWSSGIDVVQELLELLAGRYGVGPPAEMLGHVVDTLRENGFDLGEAPGIVWEKPIPKNESTKRLKKTYAPESKDNFNAMITVFGNAETPDDLNSLLLLYILDESYARADIAMAEKYTRLSKRWA